MQWMFWMKKKGAWAAAFAEIAKCAWILARKVQLKELRWAMILHIFLTLINALAAAYAQAFALAAFGRWQAILKIKPLGGLLHKQISIFPLKHGCKFACLQCFGAPKVLAQLLNLPLFQLILLQKSA